MRQRVILMSDIHGNLPALEAVAQSLPAHDEVIVAGDLCLEGPCPAQVLDRLVAWGWSLVMGNTDRDIVDAPDDIAQRKQELVTWTRAQLGVARLKRLAELPFSQVVLAGDEAVLVVHANPCNMQEHLRPTMSDAELAPYLQTVDAQILAFGHYHIPWQRPVRGTLLVDVASVGHPKDHDLRAAYTVLTVEGDRREVNHVRIPYDVDQTVALMRRCGMPDADREVESLLKASY